MAVNGGNITRRRMPSDPAGTMTAGAPKSLSAATPDWSTRAQKPEPPQEQPVTGRPTALETRRREREFVITLATTGSVDQALKASRIKPARVGQLLDRPDVRSVLAHTLEAAA